MKRPVPSDLSSRTAFVPSLMSVTEAPAIAAPDESTTVPASVPEITCDRIRSSQVSVINTATAVAEMRRLEECLNWFMVHLFKNTNSHRHPRRHQTVESIGQTI